MSNKWIDFHCKFEWKKNKKITPDDDDVFVDLFVDDDDDEYVDDVIVLCMDDAAEEESTFVWLCFVVDDVLLGWLNGQVDSCCLRTWCMITKDQITTPPKKKQRF